MWLKPDQNNSHFTHQPTYTDDSSCYLCCHRFPGYSAVLVTKASAVAIFLSYLPSLTKSLSFTGRFGYANAPEVFRPAVLTYYIFSGFRLLKQWGNRSRVTQCLRPCLPPQSTNARHTILHFNTQNTETYVSDVSFIHRNFNNTLTALVVIATLTCLHLFRLRSPIHHGGCAIYHIKIPLFFSFHLERI